jgi:ribosome maturation factor RimP
VTLQAELLEKLRPTLERIVDFAGMELVHAEARPESGGLVLRLFIDREGGVTLDDCATVSRQVSAQLDLEDPIPGHYTLEVSSPGLDRPLVKDHDFARFEGNAVRIETAAPLEGRRHFRGRLGRLEGGMVRLALEDGSEVSIPRELVTRARLEPEFGSGGASRTKGRHA